MQKDINKLESTWLKAGEHGIQGEVEGAGLVYPGDLIAFFSDLISGYREVRVKLLSEVLSDRTRGNGHKLQQGQFWLSIRKICSECSQKMEQVV